MKVTEIAKTIFQSDIYDEIGIRLGEKMHEQMISLEDSMTTFEYKDHYKILPSINNWHMDKARIGREKSTIRFQIF